MATLKSVKIGSLRELQLQMPRIVQALNANQALALAAATNPMLALEELGYELSPQARLEIEPYARFGPDNLQKLADLEAKIYGQLRVEKLPTNLAEARLIFEKMDSGLGKTVQQQSTKPPKTGTIDAALSEIFALKTRSAVEEEKLLADLAALHPALPLLFESQKIHRQRPAFSDRDMFEKIKSGQKKTIFTKVEFRLRDSAERKQKQTAQ